MYKREQLYNDYLTDKINESQLVVGLDTLQHKEIKSDGVIYTPWGVVTHMIELSQPSIENTVIEPSFGHGIFFFGLLEYMRNNVSNSGEEVLEWFKSNVYGIEISESTVAETKNAICLYFKKHYNLKVTPDSFDKLVCGDGLYHDFSVDFDLCIGNPPYIRTKNLEDSYLKKIRKDFTSCVKGNVDIYYAFIEKYTIAAKQLCFITPNSYLTNVSGKSLREIVIPSLSILIDFKEKLVFKDARTYTCIFKYLRGRTLNEMLYANDMVDIGNYNTVSKESLFGNEDNEESLVSNVLSGVATLCDSVYLVEKHNDGNFYATGNGKLYEIEEGIVVPYLKITKIKSDTLQNVSYMIYPYNEDKSIIKESELSDKYPMAHKYLLSMKDRLQQRDKGKTDKYESWYAYGRKQGLHKISESFVIVVPQMIGGECKPHKIDISNLLTQYGSIVFTSGFVVPQTADNKCVFHGT